jgi:hypothetical protein
LKGAVGKKGLTLVVSLQDGAGETRIELYVYILQLAVLETKPRALQILLDLAK